MEADNINIIRKLFLCDDRHNYYSLSSIMFYFYTTISFFIYLKHTHKSIFYVHCKSKLNTNYYILKSNKNCTKFYSNSEYESMYNSHTIRFYIRFFLSMHLLQKSYCVNTKDKCWELMQNGFKIDGCATSYFHPTVWGESHCENSKTNKKSKRKSDWWPFDLTVLQICYNCLNIASCDCTFCNSSL